MESALDRCHGALHRAIAVDWIRRFLETRSTVSSLNRHGAYNAMQCCVSTLESLHHGSQSRKQAACTTLG
jgi:hypothetical protein